MKRPSAHLMFLSAACLVAAFAPSLPSSVVAVLALVLVSLIWRKLLGFASVLLKSLFHRQYIKPPSNLVAIGVLLSLAFVVIGFLWNPAGVSISFGPGKMFLSLLSIAGHFACLGVFVGFVSLLQYAPDFRA